MNNTILTGRLTRQPERRSTRNGATVCRFSLAVDKYSNGEKTAMFINCVAYGKTAEFIVNYCDKGDKLGVEGSVDSYSYDSNGVKRYVTEILCNRVELEGKATKTPQEPRKQATEPTVEDFGENNLTLDDIDFMEEDLPF